MAGNLSIKHAHPEFPSDVFIVLEALDAQVIIQQTAEEQKAVSLADYLKTPMEGKIIRGFVLPVYSKESFLFDSYKVSMQLDRNTIDDKLGLHVIGLIFHLISFRSCHVPRTLTLM